MWPVPVIWEGGDCFIIGGGPSLTGIFNIPSGVVNSVTSGESPMSAYSPYLSPIHNKHVIAINGAYKLGLWVDVCIFGDNGWYLSNRRALAKWPNLKVSCAPWFSNKEGPALEGIKYVPKTPVTVRGLSTSPKCILWGYHTGASAINLATLFGAKRIYLIGFDMRLSEEGNSHWHFEYGTARKSPPFRRHLAVYPFIAADAKKMGIEIINLSPNSAIKDIPHGRPPWLD